MPPHESIDRFSDLNFSRFILLLFPWGISFYSAFSVDCHCPMVSSSFFFSFAFGYWIGVICLCCGTAQMSSMNLHRDFLQR